MTSTGPKAWFSVPMGTSMSPAFATLKLVNGQMIRTSTDKILIFSGLASDKPGTFIGKIDLDQVGQNDAYAQALLFGPGGKLFVPISVPVSSSQYAGQVRLYDVSDHHHITYDIFVPSSSNLGSGWYLTFGNTDPATLNYMSPR